MLTEGQKRSCMTVEEVAAELGYSKPTAYAIINREDFPKIRYGRKIIIPRVLFEGWLRNTAANGGADLKATP